jgi:hypothetical protein
MSTDRELLELAAKAAGYKFDSTEPFEIAVPHKGGNNYVEWNPLTDDGDALRLAVKLGMVIHLVDKNSVTVDWYGPMEAITEEFDDECNACLSTRRAIVRAAAEIGRNL